MQITWECPACHHANTAEVAVPETKEGRTDSCAACGQRCAIMYTASGVETVDTVTYGE